MELLLVALFALGLGIGLLMRVFRPAPTPAKSSRPQKDSLDSVDQMFLWGEVTGDDFYRM